MSHWTFEHRKIINNLLSHKKSSVEIAKTIGFDPTSMSKEIKRNRYISKPSKNIGKTYCKRLDRFPFVCLDCKEKYSGCHFIQYSYDA